MIFSRSMQKHSRNVKPVRWGSFQDVQYAIRKNAEQIYKVDPDSMVLCMPLFWGLPALDYSGKANHGTNHGTTYKNGRLDFDGSDYVSVADGNTLDFENATEDFSISARIKRGSIDDYMPIASKGDNNDDFWRFLFWNDNTVFASIDTIDIQSASTITDTTNYHHIAVSFDRDGNGQIYIDGSANGNPVALNSEVMSIDSQVTWIGGWSITQFFNGIIDEIRISNTARSADEIALFHDRPWDLYRPVQRVIYSLPGFIQKLVEAKYDIFLQKPIEAKYDIHAQKLIESLYDIQLQKLIEGKYDILSFVQKLIESKYDILLQKTTEAKYDVLLQKSVEAKYDILLQKLIESKYDIQLQKVIEAVYDVLLQKIGEAQYDILLQKTIEAKNDILLQKTVEAKYDIHLQQTINALYDILSGVQKLLEAGYDIHLQKDIEALYDIIIAASVRKAYKVIGRTKNFKVIGRTKNFKVIGRTKNFKVIKQ